MNYSIFDVDGTILDSMKIWNDLASRYIYSIQKVPDPDLDKIVSNMSLEQSAHYLKEKYEIAFSEKDIIKSILNIISDFYKYEVQLKPGFKTFIENYPSKNVIATSSDENLVKAALSRLQVLSYFEKIITCSKVKKSKKEPDIYLACAQYLHQKPENIYVFEDANFCIDTAKKAGFKVVGVQDVEIISSPCDVYIKDWRQIGGTTLCRGIK